MLNFVPPSKGIYKNKKDGKLGFRSIIGSPPSYIIPIYYDEQNNAHFLNFGDPNYDEKYLLCNDLVTMYLDVTEDGFVSLIFTNNIDRDLCDWAVDGQVCYVSDIYKYYKWVDSMSEWEEVFVEKVISHVQSDWEEKDKDESSYIRNKPITIPIMQLPIADSVENNDTIRILHNAKKFGYLYSGWTFLDLIDNGGTPELQYNSRLINGDYSSFRVPTDDDWKSLEEELGMPEGERNFEKTEIDRGHNAKVGVKMSGFMNLFTEEYKGYFMDGDEVDADFGLSRFDIVPSGFLEYSSSLGGSYTFSHGRELSRGVWWSQTHEIKQGVYRSMIRRVFPKDVNKPEHIDFAKGVARVYGRVNTGLSMRLVRDTTGGESSLDNFTIIKKAYVDNVNNEYDGVKIGNYVWLTQNLLDTKYNDGSDINHVDNNDNNWEDWNDSYIAQEGAYCAYMFDENNAKNEVADEYRASAKMIREGIEMYISCTYNEFMLLKNNSELVPNTEYCITDYQAIYDQPDFEDIDGNIVPKMTIATKTAAVEKLVVLATSSNTIAPQAWSIDYPKDYIEYDPDLTTTYVNEAATKGKITFRRDENGNEANCDLKGVLLKRYDRNGDGKFVHIADSGSDDFDDEIAIFGNMCFNNRCSKNGEILYLLLESPFDVANIQLGEGCYNNQFDLGCLDIQLGKRCYNNQFRDGCNYIQLGKDCMGNQFMKVLISVIFGDGVQNNTFEINIEYVDLTLATHIYQWYSCWIFRNAGGDVKLRYYDENNILQIVDITD